MTPYGSEASKSASANDHGCGSKSVGSGPRWMKSPNDSGCSRMRHYILCEALYHRTIMRSPEVSHTLLRWSSGWALTSMRRVSLRCVQCSPAKTAQDRSQTEPRPLIRSTQVQSRRCSISSCSVLTLNLRPRPDRSMDWECGLGRPRASTESVPYRP